MRRLLLVPLLLLSRCAAFSFRLAVDDSHLPAEDAGVARGGAPREDEEEGVATRAFRALLATFVLTGVVAAGTSLRSNDAADTLSPPPWTLP